MKRIAIIDLLALPPSEKEIQLKGWVRTRRGSKHISFVSLNDGSTINNIQIVIEVVNFEEELIRQITTGSCLSIEGKLVKSQGGEQAVEVVANTITILGGANADDYPLQPKKHSLEFLRANAHLRFRTNTFSYKIITFILHSTQGLFLAMLT